MEGIRFGDIDVEDIIKPIMKNTGIFGVDLYEAGLADKVCGCCKELIAGPGAVRETLEKYA